MDTEKHPLEPFLPKEARLLMLGSFPPKRDRWSMEFFYPNFQNDMWRIFGILFFDDKNHFVIKDQKKFDKQKIISFCEQEGLALFDTAIEVKRLKDNASDNYLEVVQETDIDGLLSMIPKCRHIVATGQKAAEIISKKYGCELPKVGCGTSFQYGTRQITFSRMPSSSRAYPLPLEHKAQTYKKCFTEIGFM